MDEVWLNEFRHRLAESKNLAHSPDQRLISIKVRVSSGCFHREHSPRAYEIIDKYLQDHPELEKDSRFVEHESGPEVIAYIALGTSVIAFSTSVINLVVAIINARKAGAKKGDGPHAPLDLLVRGFRDDGGYFQESIAHIDDLSEFSESTISTLIERSFKPLPLPRSETKSSKTQ